MIQLLKIEFRKLLPYGAFRWMVGFYLVLLVLTILITLSLFNNIEISMGEIDISAAAFYGFGDVWQNISYVAFLLSFFLVLLMILAVANDLSYRINRQHVIDGLSRSDTVTGKILLILTFAVGSGFLLFVIGSILGLVYDDGEGVFYHRLEFIPTYMLQFTGYSMLAMVITYLVRRSALAILLFLVYILIVEPILTSQLFGRVDDLLGLERGLTMISPSRAFFRLNNSFPALRYLPVDAEDAVNLSTRTYVPWKELVVSVVWLPILAFFAYRSENRRDL